jgi:hypothetical protein
MRELHDVIDQAIVPRSDGKTTPGKQFDISAIDFDRLRAEFERRPTKRTDTLTLMDAVEKRLARMLAENPTRTNFQAHYEEIVAAYNGEKDRVTIEATFEALLKFTASLDDEASRAMREGLDPETLTLFDLLKKPDLSTSDINRLKKVAASLLTTLEQRKTEIDDWRAKEATRDLTRQTINDFLYSDETGLPGSYSPEEIAQKNSSCFRTHLYGNDLRRGGNMEAILRSTIIAPNPWAATCHRLEAAKAGLIGQRVLAIEYAAARLAGGFLQPVNRIAVVGAVRVALDKTCPQEFEIAKDLPGLVR